MNPELLIAFLIFYTTNINVNQKETEGVIQV